MSVYPATKIRRHCIQIGVLVAMWSVSVTGGAANTTVSPSTSSPIAQDEPIDPITPAGLADPRKVMLGERLFHDPRLSRDNQTSCATCHPLNDGGTDHKSHIVTINDTAVAFNTPSVFNASLSFRLGWIGSSLSAVDHIDAMVRDQYVFNIDWKEITRRVTQDSTYITSMRAIYDAYPRADDIRDLLTTYISSLVTPNSRFDQFLRGDDDALTADEKAGYVEFKSHGCIACHQGVNVGGNLFQRFGVFEDYFAIRGDIQAADSGRFLVTGRTRDTHVFRVPSLRNVGITSPYFHDGSAATLEDAVKVMARYQLGNSANDAEVKLIVQFLRTLTGQFQDRPL